VTDFTVFWPLILGLSFLVAGILSYRKDVLAVKSRGIFAITVLGPTFIAAALAAFAGEHFTIAKAMTGLVPKWMPAQLFIVYFVGVAHLCAALSLVAKRYVRWAALGLAIMFAMFVLTLYLPSVVRNPHVRIAWIFPFREGTYAMGGLALFATAVRHRAPRFANRIAIIVQIWTAVTLIFFGSQNVLYPQFTPGVPDNRPTLPWVPFPHAIAYAVGLLLIFFGATALVRRYSIPAIASGGLVMVVLTLGLFVPEFFLAHTAAQWLEAINFIFDTLLFGGTLFVIANAQRPANIA
jgi:uncharacterized membrane protein